MAIAQVFLFRCPDCADSILLPRQSLLGIYEGQHYQRNPLNWPIAFLCRRHERLCEGHPDMIHQEAFARPAPPQPHFALWQIDCVCGQPNCGLPTTIYTHYLPADTQGSIVSLLRQATGKLLCGDHDVDLQAGKLTLKPLEY